MPDKFTAIWISHSAIADFLRCPRAYYINYLYKEPRTGRRVTLISPPLALGQAVHEVIESLSILRAEVRFKEGLAQKLEIAWKKITGKLGGFTDSDQEQKYYQRGLSMLARVTQNPGPLKNRAVKINMDLPYFWLSQTDNIILCGKIDWLEYLSDTNSVHVIDFKTSRTQENSASLQLPIYYLLANHCQTRPVSKLSYWYLEHSDTLSENPLPDLNTAENKILKISKEMKLARQLDRFLCPQGQTGCSACRPLEAIVNGQAQFVGVDQDKRKSLFILPEPTEPNSTSTII